MSFEQRLRLRARDVEAQLAEILAVSAATGQATPERLASAMRYAVMSGGKRIRPFLVLETAGLFGIDAQTAMPTATALELIHCYSLVHDDLPAMDNDSLRRGQPTVWRAFDDWTAILAGDALLTLAFEHIAQQGRSVAPETACKLTAELAQAAGRAGMVGGQCRDLEADKLGAGLPPTAGSVERLQAMKTGALFRFACRAGGLLGAADDHQLNALTRFGERLGAAFQLADDLLDVEGEVAVVGKATGKDAAAGKATLIWVLGVETAKARLKDIAAAALEDLEQFTGRAEALKAALQFAIERRS